jgi:hypothetical protein
MYVSTFLVDASVEIEKIRALLVDVEGRKVEAAAFKGQALPAGILVDPALARVADKGILVAEQASESGTWDRYYDFLNIFGQKKLRKNGVFCSKCC